MRSVGPPSAWKQWVWNTRCYQTKTILTMIDFTDPQPSPSFWKLGWQYLNHVAHTAVTVSITVSPLTLQIRIRTDPVWLIFPTDSTDFHRLYMTHKNQDKPLVFDADVSASHRFYSRLKILERAQIFSACYTITLRALHQPQGDKQKINIIS